MCYAFRSGCTTSENVAQGGFHARTEAGPTRTWVAHGTADHGAARPPRAALGASHLVGGAPRAARLPRAPRALRRHVAERPDAAPARAARGGDHRARHGRLRGDRGRKEPAPRSGAPQGLGGAMGPTLREVPPPGVALPR